MWLVVIVWFLAASQRRVDSFQIDYRYTAPDDSLVGKTVPCNYRERQCLRFNRLYHPRMDACYPFLDGPRNCVFVGDHAEFQFRGHLRGKCLTLAPCCLRRTLSAFHCAVDEYLKENFCVPENNTTWSVGVFGNFECRCLPRTACRDRGRFPPTPQWQYLDAEVSPSAGRCRVSSLAAGDVLSAPLSPSVSPSLPPRAFARHRRCLAYGGVFEDRRRSCFPLRARGPCAEGQTLVLSRRLWRQKRAVAVCERRFLCAPGSRRLAFDGRCYPEADLRAALRPGEDLVLNRFGETYAAFRRPRPQPTPSSLQSRLQALRGNCYASANADVQMVKRYIDGGWMHS